jgi:organic hydroperoxide reductase OsmC/OhrA
MDVEGRFEIALHHQGDYRFAVYFDKPGIAPLITDEGAPIGTDAGPTPTQLLGTAVANCLSASLLFALRKFKNDPGLLRTLATVHLGRNEQRRLRVVRIDVALHLGVPAADLQLLERALGQFEDFCVVTQSVRLSIPVEVRVMDSLGAVLKG